MTTPPLDKGEDELLVAIQVSLPMNNQGETIAKPTRLASFFRVYAASHPKPSEQPALADEGELEKKLSEVFGRHRNDAWSNGFNTGDESYIQEVISYLSTHQSKGD